ncbi:winged helix-turn-helix transcriptional regulator [Escherichia coli]|nr:winged helix-turn-helix transcriptional regulator [Escherichia coli]
MPPKVEYSLTDEGETLREVLDLMCSWGNARIEKDPNAVNLYKEHEKKLSH